MGKVYIGGRVKYDYQMWVRRVQWFTGNSRYWETTGPGTPGPYRVVNEGTAVSGKSESSNRERQSVGSRSGKGKQGRLPHSREGARGIRKISACALYGKDLYYYYNTI